MASKDVSNQPIFAVQGVGAGWAGWEISMQGKTLLQLNGEAFYVTGSPQQGMWVPKSGTTTKLFIYRPSNPKQVFRLDYHPLQSSPNRPVWHYNTTKHLARVSGLTTVDHAVTFSAKATGTLLTVFRWAGRASFIAGGAMSLYEIYHAESRPREVVRQVSGWAAAGIAGRTCAPWGAKIGAAVPGVLGQLGPQVAIPEEVVTIPAGVVIGSAAAGTLCGIGGYFAGAKAAETTYDWFFESLSKEEWLIFSEE